MPDLRASEIMGAALAEAPHGKGLQRLGQKWPRSLGSEHCRLPPDSSSSVFGMLKRFPSWGFWKGQEEKPHDLKPCMRISFLIHLAYFLQASLSFSFSEPRLAPLSQKLSAQWCRASSEMEEMQGTAVGVREALDSIAVRNPAYRHVLLLTHTR